MRIFNLVIRHKDEKPLFKNPCVKKITNNQNILDVSLENQITRQRISIDYNISHDIELIDDVYVKRYIRNNDESYIDYNCQSLIYNKINSHLEIRNGITTLKPMITSNINLLYSDPSYYNPKYHKITSDETIILLSIDLQKYALVKSFTKEEIFQTCLDGRTQCLSCGFKINSIYNNLNYKYIIIYLYDKINKKFVKVFINVNEVLIGITVEDLDKNDNNYNDIVNNFNPEHFKSFKLKFDNILTKFIVYNPEKFDKDELIEKVKPFNNFPVLISWKDIGGNVDGLENFINNSLVTKNINSLTLCGITDIIPFTVFKNIESVFMVNEKDSKPFCVKSR